MLSLLPVTSPSLGVYHLPTYTGYVWKMKPNCFRVNEQRAKLIYIIHSLHHRQLLIFFPWASWKILWTLWGWRITRWELLFYSST